MASVVIIEQSCMFWLPRTRADPGFEVRGGANGLENIWKWIGKYLEDIENREGGGDYINTFKIRLHFLIVYICIYDIFQRRFFRTILYILGPLTSTIF